MPDDSEHGTPPERRGAPRILCRVRLRLEPEGSPCEATTAVINAQGALILAPERLPEGARVRITNLERGLSHPFRVVWCGDATGGLHKLGVELLTPTADFWGPAYRPEEEG